MKLRVTRRNLFVGGREAAIGSTFNVKGNTVPVLYRGKVDVVPDDVKPAEPSADDKRKVFLADEIERLSGKRPGGNTKLDTLEERYAELNKPSETDGVASDE